MKHIAYVLSLVALLVMDGQAANITGRVAVARAVNDGEAVIYIDKIPGRTFSPPAEPRTLDQINLKFSPHVMVVLVGTTVLFPNSDVVRHNVFSPGPPLQFSLGTYPIHTTRTQLFSKPGVVTLLCNIHAEMSAFVIVTETPYFAISDAQGNYTIPDVPPGRYVLKAWHERGRATSQQITVESNDLKGINFDLKR
jgi:hypothetical protein